MRADYPRATMVGEEADREREEGAGREREAVAERANGRAGGETGAGAHTTDVAAPCGPTERGAGVHGEEDADREREKGLGKE